MKIGINKKGKFVGLLPVNSDKYVECETKFQFIMQRNYYINIYKGVDGNDIENCELLGIIPFIPTRSPFNYYTLAVDEIGMVSSNIYSQDGKKKDIVKLYEPEYIA